MGYIQRREAEHVKKLAERPAEKGIITPAEVRCLLHPGTVQTVWRSSALHYSINLLAATTGMRIGIPQIRWTMN